MHLILSVLEVKNMKIVKVKNLSIYKNNNQYYKIT